MPRKSRNKKRVTPVLNTLIEIHNTGFTGKEVIVFHDNKWNHYWIPSKGKVSIPSHYKASSSLTEMVRRDQIQIVRR